MTDNITLPRAVITHMRSELHALVREADSDCGDSDCDECKPLRPIRAAITVLDAALAEPEPESKTPAWWMDGLTVTLMREGVNKHRAREIAVGYWEAYCQIPGNEEDEI